MARLLAVEVDVAWVQVFGASLKGIEGSVYAYNDRAQPQPESTSFEMKADLLIDWPTNLEA